MTRLRGFFLLALASISMQMADAQVRTDAQANPFAGDANAAAAGKRLFDASCVACHGAGGAGTERAPGLDTGRFKHGGEDFDVFQSIQKGVAGTQMPPFSSLRAEEIWQLVSYVRSLSRVASNDATAAPTGDASRGEQLFFGEGRCSTCHEINGRGSLVAPDLSESGKHPPAAIRAGIEHAPRPFGPSPRYVKVSLRDGTQIDGLVKNEDSFTLVVQTFDGEYRALDRRQIRTVASAPASFAQGLTSEQKGDVVAYLSRQKQRAVVAGEEALKRRAAERGAALGLSFERLSRAEREPHNWLTYWGSYRAEHFSELTQIDRRNVATLQARWAASLPGSSPLESTPLVVDGIMYVSGPPGDVYALDARSGLQLWKFHREQQRVNPFQINPFNKGVAVLGQRVFVNTLDNNLIALDARSGRVLWEQNLADTLEGYTMTGAPLALDDKVIVGISGGELGIRGFISAYDARDGRLLWRFDTIPDSAQPGHDTWPGDSWKTGGGATWLTGSYDAELHLLYWAVGNPGPDYDPTKRKGDNLYSCSVLALDPSTGRLVWHYQFSPHDTHDWDSTEDMILAEVPVRGHARKVILHADRNGFFYTLDRASGAFISAVPFVRQTWNKGFEPNGRPIFDPASLSTPEGHPIAPSIGGTNFQAPSYDRKQQVLFLSFIDAEGNASYEPAQYQRGQIFTGAHFGAQRPPSVEPAQGVMALDVASGRKLWTFPLTRGSLSAGVLATRGDVVFAASAEGNLIALDARSGQSLWHFQTGGQMMASPISYSVGGTQFVAIAAGNTLYSFALSEHHQGDR
jgi:alcohol dehydrogenase (cytochrome c)